MTNPFNIHMTGVGGQGIGLLSQTLLRAVDCAGIRAIAVDTHGLAQRGGMVVSRIRMGENVFSPLIMAHGADLVLGMEIHEALRGAHTALKKNGILCYLNVAWQPLAVRLGQADSVAETQIKTVCEEMDARAFCVDAETIDDPRMQNMALIGTIAANKLIPGVDMNHYRQALKDLLAGPVLDKNLALLESYGKGAAPGPG
ncbi:indolepyruvate ferredoxin oxidoreductase beta subunit [Desulfocicer vacuolatum DSM 3385]|uniref:Indolepyruvate ferredoxin oxidoreductase beta subunit n=1 Tax=Desulfocicer vacuolatum DSM 3385 TaxID=1121400 RepID=A0A1W2ENZ2_9BACT|nr:2-oxoacid:acceptor oxidoreductase family protein [Desulfocicer vacuolatum]SMD10986.1 indolepyruvate ferredoxin oxidoreductase beta subunit [Desulfocicer vacuolatum DSM 3385]